MKSLAFNRKVKYEYELLEKLEVGLKLLGVEVKSVRAGHMSLKGAFVTIHENEAYLINATIPPWQIKNTPDSYNPTRSRKLLLKRNDLNHLIGSKQSKGLTIVPIRVYNKGSYIKLKIALARGKRKHDKRQTKRERDIQRDVERELRGKE